MPVYQLQSVLVMTEVDENHTGCSVTLILHLKYLTAAELLYACEPVWKYNLHVSGNRSCLSKCAALPSIPWFLETLTSICAGISVKTDPCSGFCSLPSDSRCSPPSFSRQAHSHFRVSFTLLPPHLSADSPFAGSDHTPCMLNARKHVRLSYRESGGAGTSNKICVFIFVETEEYVCE